MANEHEAHAREKKAFRLFTALLNVAATSVTIQAMREPQWKLAERAARVHPSSATTRARVLEMMREREANPLPKKTDEELFARCAE